MKLDDILESYKKKFRKAFSGLNFPEIRRLEFPPFEVRDLVPIQPMTITRTLDSTITNEIDYEDFNFEKQLEFIKKL